jgi:deazaflavin-dependent oxidoreductase (nitroreductase family)
MRTRERSVPAVPFGVALGAGFGTVVGAAIAPEAIALGMVFGAAAGLTIAAAVEAARRHDSDQGCANGKGVVMNGRSVTASTLPLIERIRMRVEHVIDSRSAPFGAWILRRTRGRVVRLWHRRALVLTTRGRRSGLARTVPLQYFPDDDRMIVVAANSGLPAPPGWYFNLMAEPRARVDVDGRTLWVRAEQLSTPEAAESWQRVLSAAPDYARYPRRTSRPIPLIRLTPAP